MNRIIFGAHAALTGLTGLSASVVAQLPDSKQLDAVGRWPLTVVLGAVCCFLAWLLYKQADKNADRYGKFEDHIDKLSESVAQLAGNLKEWQWKHRDND